MHVDTERVRQRVRSPTLARITGRQAEETAIDGWIYLGDTLSVSPSGPWMPGQEVTVFATYENFLGSAFSHSRDVLVNGSSAGQHSVSGSQGMTDTGSADVTIPSGVSQVEFGIEGVSETVSGSVEGDNGSGGDDGVTGSVAINSARVPDVQEGSPLEGTVTIANNTNKDLGFDIYWFVDGTLEAQENIGGAFEQFSGQENSYTATLGVFNPGTYSIEVVVTNFTEALPELSQNLTATVQSSGGNGGDGGNGEEPPPDDGNGNGEEPPPENGGSPPPSPEPVLEPWMIVVGLALVGGAVYVGTR